MYAVLEALPRGYQAVDVDGALVVVGPTGAFAVSTDDPDVATAARRVARTAARARNTLAAVLSWAPFVDALVVTDRTGERVEEATVVPRRRLRDVLTSGHVQLDQAEIERIAQALEGA